MKKRIFSVVVLLAIMSMFTSTVLAAPAVNKSVELVSVTYEQRGIIITFETSGLTKDDLKNATFEALSNKKGVTCDLLDDGTTVRCSVARELAGKGGFKITIAGFIFWGDLPAERYVGCPDGQIEWYYVDEYYYGVWAFSGDVPAWYWDWYEAQGYFDEDALFGYTYEISGIFCAPDVPLLPV